MNLEEFKNKLPDFDKDIKINLSNVLSETGSSPLNQLEIFTIALASIYAHRNKELNTIFTELCQPYLSSREIVAAKRAATIMAMNNIYYRFTHTISDQTYRGMAAKLRMNILANPGVDKLLFELLCLAVSTINGCSTCINAHAMQLEKSGLSKLAIQSAVRIASVVSAAALAFNLY